MRRHWRVLSAVLCRVAAASGCTRARKPREQGELSGAEKAVVAAFTSGTISRESPVRVAFHEAVVRPEQVGAPLDASPFRFESPPCGSPSTSRWTGCRPPTRPADVPSRPALVIPRDSDWTGPEGSAGVEGPSSPDSNGAPRDDWRAGGFFEAAHRDPAARVFWHLDDEYLGETRDIHQMALAPRPGPHVLVLVDERGETVRRRFTALGRSGRGSVTLPGGPVVQMVRTAGS